MFEKMATKRAGNICNMCLLDLKLTHPIMNDFTCFFDRGAVRNLGKPVSLCKRYYQDGADEV